MTLRPHRHWLLALFALAFAAVLALSPRAWSVTSRPGFDRIAPLPAAAQRPVRTWLDDHGVKLPWPGLPEAEQPELTLGHAYREVGALRMPFLAYADPGPVLFDGRGRWGPPVPLDAAGLAVVRAAAGPVDAGYRFAWWRFAWGWLVFVPLVAWYALQLRAERRRRAASGIL